MKYEKEAIELKQLMTARAKAICKDTGMDFDQLMNEYPELRYFNDLEQLSKNIETGVKNGYRAETQIRMARAIIGKL